MPEEFYDKLGIQRVLLTTNLSLSVLTLIGTDLSNRLVYIWVYLSEF